MVPACKPHNNSEIMLAFGKFCGIVVLFTETKIQEDTAMFDFLRSKRQPPTLPEGTVRRHYIFRGEVQGVGFRYRAKYAAQLLELTGWVENEDDGSVEMEVQGLPETIDAIFPILNQSDWIQITDMKVREIPVNVWDTGFHVRGY